MRVLIVAALLPLATVASPAAAQSPPTPPPAPVAPARADAPMPGAPTTAPTPPAPPPKLSAADVDREAVLKLGREVARLVTKGDVDSIMLYADPATGNPADTRERIRGALGQIGDQIGVETKVIAERVMLVNGAAQYWRDAEFSAIAVPLVMRVVVGPTGKWRGFTITPPDALPPAEEVKPE